MYFDRCRSYIIACAAIGAACSGFSLWAFSLNTWGIWMKYTRYANCFPLWPPVGCADEFYSRSVVDYSNSDFSWLCILNSVIATAAAILAVSLLEEEEKDFFGLDEQAVKKTLCICFIMASLINILICILASFRINVSVTLHQRKSLFSIGKLIPVYSISFYLTCVNTVCSFSGSFISHQLAEIETYRYSKWTKTIKQHQARNYSYVEGDSVKIVTYSSMTPEMEESAAQIAINAVTNNQLEEDIAEIVKQEFENRWGPTWHCAVGSCFGSAVHHLPEDYIEVSTPKQSVLLFRFNEPSLYHPAS